MSQGDLAEKLNVSRQSISKWETNASVPELDKLIQLCDLFGISLDELVRSDNLEAGDDREEDVPPSPPQQTQIVIQHSLTTQKIVGFILLALGLLCCLMALFAGSGLLIIGGYIIFCSILCLLIKRYACLIIGWITIIHAIVLTPFFTGVRIFSVFNPGYYKYGLGINQIISIVMWLLVAFLIFFTAKAIWKQTK
jgi:DNA-binding XRE family transcriptional regulator